MHYYGLLQKQSYELGQKLGCGGDGTVYEIQGYPDLVAKIYRPGRFASDEDRATMDRKLKAMLSIKIRDRVDGILRLAWPRDILYEDGTMVGFVMMRLVTIGKFIIYIIRASDQECSPNSHGNMRFNFPIIFLGWYGMLT